MERQGIVTMVRDLVQNQKRGVLATAGEGGAYASLMAYLPQNGGHEIVFASERDTQKYRNLQRDEDVAMLIDDRSDPENNPDDIMTVTGIGRVRNAGGDREDDLRGELAERHPRLKSFLMKDECEVLVLSVRTYRVVGRFQTDDDVETVVHGDELSID